MNLPRFHLSLATVFALTGALFSGASAAGYFDGKRFPIVTDAVFTADDYVLDQAKFWYAIYVEVGDNEGLIHDPFYPDLVFKKIHTPGFGRAASKAVEDQVNSLRQEIRGMLGKDSSVWTAQDRALKSRFPAFWDSSAISLCVDRLRFQRGLREKFRAGLERSYRYLPLIESTLVVHGVPTRLKYLPHVESSFYPYAYSKVGAAGMWQFMKSSARRYSVPVGYLVDDRRDPYASTRAAARMLAYNFSLLKSWPLAIVAYNHGPGGMAKAVRATGTSDLGTIIKSYYSNSFGFASKNFYAEFLAASSIALHADSLFPDLEKMDPLRFQTMVLRKSCGTRFLCALSGLSPSELEEYNLGLRPATFRGNTQLPKGFTLRLPEDVDMTVLSAKLGAGEAAMLAGTMAEPTPAVKVAQTQPISQDKVGNTGEEKKPEEFQPSKPKRKAFQVKHDDNRTALISNGDSVRVAKEPTIVAAPEPISSPLAGMAPGSVSGALSKPDTTAPVDHILDSTLSLQASDLDKLAHPMDRFNPIIYNLGYSYAAGYLTIQAGTDETLSHYADWAGISEGVLRKLNSMRASKGMRLGRQIRIPLGEDKAKEFVRRREEYYRAIEEDFYGHYYVSVSEPLRVEKGMNLWNWAQEKEIPFWLLQKHNVGKILSEVHPGDTLSLPIIETGIRKWGFTRYSSTQDYLAGIARFLRSGKPEAY